MLEISRVKSLLLSLTALLVLGGNLAAQTSTMTPAEAHRRAEALLKQMTVEEKVGQMNQSAGVVIPGLGSGKPDDLITQGKVGSVLWLIDVKEINRLQHLAVEKSRLHIPILFAYDVIHGYRTVFPVPLGMASSWDPSVEEAAQRLAGQDARAAGIVWTFTPMVDIARDARWGRMVEGAGEDPYLGAAMAAAQVRGFQGKTLGPESVLACVKHFAGYGAAEGGRDYDSSYVPEVLMRNVYLVPFHAAEEAGAGSFMSAYMDLNDVPATGNHWLLSDVLRKEWGFKGFVVSDAFAVGSLEVHGFARDGSDAANKAASAGLDMDMASQTYTQNLAKLVAAGKVSEATLNASVLPILEAKYKLGLFDHPYVDESQVEATLNRPEGLALERKVAGRSMVLLKNENHTLPLAKTREEDCGDWNRWPIQPRTLKAVGRWKVCLAAAARAIRSRCWPASRTGWGRMGRSTMFRVQRFRGFIRSMLDQMVGNKMVPPPSAERNSGVGGQSQERGGRCRCRGRGAGRSGRDEQRSGIARVAGTAGNPGADAGGGGFDGQAVVVLVIENGRPLDIHWAAEHVPAILEAWYPGTEGGNAVADVLFGDVNPGGKLPVSWPRSAGQEPLYYNHNLTHEPEDRPTFTSRYWDVSSKPLYPFGYGLSYASFKFGNLQLSKKSVKAGEATEVAVDVTNTGAVAGDAVAQVYIHQRAGSASRPVRQLKGFQSGDTGIRAKRKR